MESSLMPAGKEKAGRLRLVAPLSGWAYKRMKKLL